LFVLFVSYSFHIHDYIQENYTLGRYDSHIIKTLNSVPSPY